MDKLQELGFTKEIQINGDIIYFWNSYNTIDIFKRDNEWLIRCSMDLYPNELHALNEVLNEQGKL